MEQPISPEKQKALDKAQELRNKAGEEAKLRGECFEKSKKEFESGDKGKAKELSDEGKEPLRPSLMLIIWVMTCIRLICMDCMWRKLLSV